MEIRSRGEATPFTTVDGSTIRSLLDHSNAPVENQSLAEASLPAAGVTTRHYHRESEEFYYVLEGGGVMEVDGDRRRVEPGDAVIIPPGAWHQIRADDTGGLRFLCCCSPPFSRDDTFFE